MNECLKPKSKLRAWREDMELSLRDVADLTGFSVPMVSRVERGERNLAPLNRVLFARRLGVPVADLFDVEEVTDAAS